MIKPLLTKARAAVADGCHAARPLLLGLAALALLALPACDTIGSVTDRYFGDGGASQSSVAGATEEYVEILGALAKARAGGQLNAAQVSTVDDARTDARAALDNARCAQTAGRMETSNVKEAFQTEWDWCVANGHREAPGREPAAWLADAARSMDRMKAVLGEL